MTARTPATVEVDLGRVTSDCTPDVVNGSSTPALPLATRRGASWKARPPATTAEPAGATAPGRRPT